MEYGYMDELKEVINPKSDMNPYPVEGDLPLPQLFSGKYLHMLRLMISKGL